MSTLSVAGVENKNKTNMQTFRINANGLKEANRKILRRTIPLMVIAIGAGFTIFSLTQHDKGEYVSSLPIAIPVVAIALGIGIFRGIKMQRSLLNSYALTIGSNLITREQQNTQTISLYFNEVSQITREKNGAFRIKGKTANDIIIVPAQIDNHEQLESILQNIHPFTNKTAISFYERYQVLITLLVLGLMICVYTVNNKIVVAIAGILFVAFMIWSFMVVQRNKNIDRKTKTRMWWVLVVIASVIAIMIFKLKGVTS